MPAQDPLPPGKDYTKVRWYQEIPESCYCHLDILNRDLPAALYYINSFKGSCVTVHLQQEDKHQRKI